MKITITGLTAEEALSIGMSVSEGFPDSEIEITPEEVGSHIHVAAPDGGCMKPGCDRRWPGGPVMSA